jgi:hypothetical protein
MPMQHRFNVASRSVPSAMAASSSSTAPIRTTLDFTGEPLTLPPTAYDALLQRAYTTSLAAVRNEDTATGPWVYNSTEEEIEIFTKKPAGSNTECSKGIGYVDAPPLLVSMLFNSPDWRSQWDGMFDKGEKVEILDQFTSIGYNSFKAPWPVSGRDFTALGRSVILPPSAVPGLDASTGTIGAVFTFSTNIESPKKPPQKGLVRGILHFCGLWIEAVPGNPNRSKVIYCLGSDPMGSIPKSIVNAANVKQPLCVAAVRNVLLKNPKVRGEVERKIESERQKSIQNRAKLGQEVAAAPIQSTTEPAATTETPVSSTSATPSAKATDEPEADDDDELPPSQYDAVLAKAYTEALSAVRAQGATDGWVFNSRQEEVDIFMKSTPGSTVNSCKGVGIINCDVDTAELVFNNNMYRTKWDDICEESKELKVIDWRTSIMYNSFSAPWPVSARDFLAVGRAKDEPLGPKLSAGVKFSWSVTINDPVLAPPRKGYVRGTLFFAGLWIEPVPGEPNKCRVIYTLSSDPNGSIPKAIVNGANVKQPLCIATVDKFAKKSPDIVAKMRVQQKIEQEACARMKAEWKRTKKGKKTSGRSASSSSNGSSSSQPSTALDPSALQLQFSDVTSVALEPVVSLLRAVGPSTIHEQGHFVTWTGERVTDEQAHVMNEAKALEQKGVGIVFMVCQLILTFILSLFTAAPVPIESAEDDSESSAEQALPLVGTLWLELLDLRQLVTTLQTQHLANLQAEREKDGKTLVPPTMQKVFIHLELVDDVRQGQVCQATIDLTTGSFAIAPASATFRVRNPQAKLAVSVYTQSLDVVYPTLSPAALALAASNSAASQMTAQSVGGKLRNLVNPLSIGSTMASGLESGFDSFLHVFDGNSKGSAASAEALAAARGPRPIVLMGRSVLSVTDDLSAPTRQHARVAWVTIEDNEGLNGPSIVTIDELLAQQGKRALQRKKGRWDHHPLVQTQPLATYSLLLHSHYASSALADFRGSLVPRTPKCDHGYTILFQTLDGVFDLVRLAEQQRPAALNTFEKMQVGLSAAQASRPRAGPVIVSKMLLSPQNHVLQAVFYDLQRKRELLSYARQLIRAEIAPCLASVDTDVLQPRRAAGAAVSVPVAASASTVTLHGALDPSGSFNPFLFVGSYHALVENLSSLLHLLLTGVRLLSWTDVYASFFFLCAFLFVCFHPSFIAFFIATLAGIALARQAARIHFEEHLMHHTHIVDEYEKRKRDQKEKFMSVR